MIKGLGIQENIVWFTLVIYWFVNIPFGYYLAFNQNYGYEGLWISMFISLSSICVYFFFKLRQVDWHESVK